MEKKEVEKRLEDWAVRFPQEWDVVCGIRMAGLQENIRISAMLLEAGFDELHFMFLRRISYLMVGEANSRVDRIQMD